MLKVSESSLGGGPEFCDTWRSMWAIFGGSWLYFGQTYFGVLLFCGYIVYNTQLMMGGGKARQLRPDEHIMAAVSLYTDIINLFLYLLQAMARNQD